MAATSRSVTGTGPVGRRLSQAMERECFGEVLSIVRGKATIGPDSGSCWDWFKPRFVARKHYACIEFPSGRQVRVPRIVAWASAGFVGLLEDFPHVHHTCANPNCVNPDHLRPLPARLNTIESAARKHLTSRADEISHAIASESVANELSTPHKLSRPLTEVRETRRRKVDEVWCLVNIEGWTVKASCRDLEISDDMYYRGLARYFPERTRGPEGIIDAAIRDRDPQALARVLNTNTVHDPKHPECRPWGGAIRAEYASAGSESRQHYVHRVAVWMQLGCRTDAALLPELWRNPGRCYYSACVNPEHWELITDFLETVQTKILWSEIDRIQGLTNHLAALNPKHPVLRDGWEVYLPDHLRRRLTGPLQRQ